MFMSIWLAKLEEGWRLRQEGNIGAVEKVVPILLRDLGIAQESSFDETLKSLVNAGVPATGAAEFALLEVSLLRRRMMLDEAEQNTAKIARWMQLQRCPATFQLPMQRGLNALARSDRAHAFEAFRAAVALATTPSEEVSSRMNLILSGEDLGFPVEQDLAVLAELLSCHGEA